MTVSLVGAGPGDPGLITVRGAELLRRADVVVYDRLAAPELLDLARPEAELIDVGKRPGGSHRQGEINDILLDRGGAGLDVVRLKGGDPFIFGRGGEELEALLAAGVPVEVVPGVTSAIAAPAYAGIPVTHRGVSTSVTIVTGHLGDPTAPGGVDWASLARCGGTLVVMMGIERRAAIAGALIDGGRAEDTPVAITRQGTTPAQVTVRTTLVGLADVEVEPPCTIVVGQVAALDLSWFESRPLAGRSVVVTRAPGSASALVSMLSELGAMTVVLPVIEVLAPGDGGAALRRAAERVRGYDWVIFTSAVAADAFLALIRDGRDMGPSQIGVVGPATAEAVRAWKLVPDLVPRSASAQQMVDAMPSAPSVAGRERDSGRVLFVRAAEDRGVVAPGLKAKGWLVDEVEAYRTSVVDEASRFDEASVRDAMEADAVTFASPSAVRGFAALMDRVVSSEPAGSQDASKSSTAVAVCIGSTTAAEARAAGFEKVVEADEQSMRGLATAVRHALT